MTRGPSMGCLPPARTAYPPGTERELRRDELITKLCDNLAESVDMDTLIACFYEDQFKYFDKEADSSELLEWLVSTETITEEEANALEKNGF